MTSIAKIAKLLWKSMVGKPIDGFECPDVRGIHNGKYEVSSEYKAQAKIDGWGVEITIKRGFVFDGASVPRLLWFVAGEPMQPPRVAAALVHDWLYATMILSRAKADWIYAQIQAQAGVAWWKIAVEWLALRRFGERAWKQKTLTESRIARKYGLIVYL